MRSMRILLILAMCVVLVGCGDDSRGVGRKCRVRWYGYSNGLRVDEDYVIYYPMYHKDFRVVTGGKVESPTQTKVAVARNQAVLDPQVGQFNVEPQDFDGIPMSGTKLSSQSAQMWTDGRWVLARRSEDGQSRIGHAGA